MVTVKKHYKIQLKLSYELNIEEGRLDPTNDLADKFGQTMVVILLSSNATVETCSDFARNEATIRFAAL